MQALKRGYFNICTFNSAFVLSCRPITFLSSLSALPAIQGGDAASRASQGSQAEGLREDCNGPTGQEASSRLGGRWQQAGALRGPNLARPFASQGTGDARSSAPGAQLGQRLDEEASTPQAEDEGVEREGEAGPLGGEDDESGDEEPPLPGGRHADEITRMLQAREESSSGLEAKADAFGPPKEGMEEWLSYFRMKVVDVNRTSRGSPTGGIGRFSALVVVGNSNGVIGLGMGKSTALGEAVKKANRQALKTLFYVPRYNKATILHPLVAKYGKCKVTMYPRSSGSGTMASNLISDICSLAGIADIGVKVHGTRNVRNTVKALIQGFESQTIPDEEAHLPIVKLEKQQRKRVKGVATVQTAGLLSI